jgi:RNA polymerase sigma factor (sigma-70 family)
MPLENKAPTQPNEASRQPNEKLWECFGHLYQNEQYKDVIKLSYLLLKGRIGVVIQHFHLENDKEDIIHDVFIDMYRELKNKTFIHNSPQQTLAWIARKTTWACCAAIKRYPDRPVSYDEMSSKFEQDLCFEITEKDIQRLIDISKLKIAFSQLNNDDQLLLKLRYRDRESWKEIAQTLGIEEVTARQRLQRLKEKLDAYFPPEER